MVPENSFFSQRFNCSLDFVLSFYFNFIHLFPYTFASCLIMFIFSHIFIPFSWFTFYSTAALVGLTVVTSIFSFLFNIGYIFIIFLYLLSHISHNINKVSISLAYYE